MKQIPDMPLGQALTIAQLLAEAHADAHRPHRGGYTPEQAEALAVARTLKEFRQTLATDSPRLAEAMPLGHKKKDRRR